MREYHPCPFCTDEMRHAMIVAEMRAAVKDRRDRFAMAALTGLQFHRDGSLFTTEGVVRQAVALADALIAELDKEQSRE